MKTALSKSRNNQTALGDTRSKLMELGSELLLSRGYNGFSYQDLSDRLGIRKASIHHHFSSKEVLGLALLEQYQNDFNQLTLHASEEGWDAVSCISAFINVFAGIAKKGDRVCPCGALCGEHGAIPENLQKKLNSFQESQRQWLREKLALGRKSGKVKPQGTIDGQAEFILAALQGAVQINRLVKPHLSFKLVTEQLEATIFG